MVIIVKKNILFQILLGACLAVPYLSNYEVTFALWSLTVLITFKGSYSVTFIKYTALFVFIFLVALLATDFDNVKFYFILRDLTYMLKPVLGLLLGYQICRFIYKNMFETLVYSGLGISLIHISIIIKTLLIHRQVSVALLREYSGYFSDLEVYILILVIFYREFGLTFSKRTFYLLVTIIGFSSFMYLSRTNFIQFVILFLALKGYFVLNRRAIIGITSVVVLTLALYSIVLFINPKRTGSGVDEFLYKIKVAPMEPFKTRVDASDYKDFNINYRSLETIYTLKQVQNKGRGAMVFGSGLGSQVDLKRPVYLGDMELRYISVLHNGFMTTYLKSGIVGVAILIISIFFLFRQRSTQIPINKQINFLLAGTSIFLLVSNWVLMGYYFTQDSKSVIVGLLFAYREISSRNPNSANDSPNLELRE